MDVRRPGGMYKVFDTGLNINFSSNAAGYIYPSKVEFNTNMILSCTASSTRIPEVNVFS